MHGTILSVSVQPGDRVVAGEPVAVLEAMKMETSIVALAEGTVAEVRAQVGDVVEAGQPIVVVG
jgi:biotin carboxyl carrier protein